MVFDVQYNIIPTYIFSKYTVIAICITVGYKKYYSNDIIITLYVDN